MTLMQKRGRDKLRIIAEILEIAEDGTLKTQIMYRANLSFTQLNEYLDFLLEIGLLSKTTIHEKGVYKATSQGLDFLTRYNEITTLLQSESAKSTRDESAGVEIKAEASPRGKK
jgi:predicted transcriptional regulator